VVVVGADGMEAFREFGDLDFITEVAHQALCVIQVCFG